MSAPASPPDGQAYGQEAQGWRGYLAAARSDLGRYAIFPLLRHLEARARGWPRLGRARLPAQDVVELAQAPTLAFPQTTLADIALDHQRPRVRGYYLGLTGPMAPLPLHLTEVAYDEERHGRTQPFGRFLDLVARRMLHFFYRAWADAQPAAQADRPDDDRFAGYLAALTGAMQGARAGDAFAPEARLQYAALFVGRRSVGAIEDALGHLLDTKVVVHPFEPRWRPIDRPDQSQLGRAGGFATLGEDAMAGGRVRQVADAYRVTIHAASYADYLSLLPGGRRHALATEALAAFAPTHLDWLIELEIDASQAPPARLTGGTALGWTGWLGPRRGTSPPAGVRADTRLRRGAKPGNQDGRASGAPMGGVEHG